MHPTENTNFERQSAAYEAGVAACSSGQPRQSNPHADSQERASLFAGYDRAVELENDEES